MKEHATKISEFERALTVLCHSALNGEIPHEMVPRSAATLALAAITMASVAIKMSGGQDEHVMRRELDTIRKSTNLSDGLQQALYGLIYDMVVIRSKREFH